MAIKVEVANRVEMWAGVSGNFPEKAECDEWAKNM